MSPKLLIAVAVLLVLLLVVGVGVGFSQGDGDGGAFPPEWVKSMDKLLVRRQPLTAEDVRFSNPESCREGLRSGHFELLEGGSCALDIRSADAPARTLALRLEEGVQVEVRFVPRGDKGLTAKVMLDAGKPETEVRVYKEGGALEVFCVSAGGANRCRVATE